MLSNLFHIRYSAINFLRMHELILLQWHLVMSAYKQNRTQTKFFNKLHEEYRKNKNTDV